jgi:hypothetical protein
MEKSIVDIDSGHQNRLYSCQMVLFDEESSY